MDDQITGATCVVQEGVLINSETGEVCTLGELTVTMDGTAPSTQPPQEPSNAPLTCPALGCKQKGQRQIGNRDNLLGSPDRPGRGGPVKAGSTKPGKNDSKKGKASPKECRKLADRAMIGTPIDDSDQVLVVIRRSYLSPLRSDLETARQLAAAERFTNGHVSAQRQEQIDSLANNLAFYIKLDVAPDARKEFEAKNCANVLGLKL
jgi:hypothetical protein